ncbi:MAG: nucleotidyl transferase AbiEii/AbiGii toxin family protein [Bdellovibrionales bacterium]|nr:nucleotidyl transferase AbiEii/AbiGii toxin family protein [Bdellovibrionales bacterium]
MAKKPFLHDHEQFKDLIQIVSDKLKIVPQLVEKDYWIMHCLWGMQQNLEFELKGGTSLSKGFRVVDRFSEDLDIRIEPPAKMDVKCGKNHDKPAHIESRRKYFDWIKDEIKIPGIVSVVRDTTYDDAILRNGGIRLHYKSHFPALAGVKDGILLEVGFDDTTPNKAVTISSWAQDHAASEKVPFQDTRAVNVKCYNIEYTFVEKLQTVSTKFRKQQESGTFPTNFMRHYYDIHQLLAQPEVQKYIGTDEYEARKKVRFRSGDNLKISENEAFLLSDGATKELYEGEYKKTASLYYKGQVPFDDILARIKQHIDSL